MVIGIPQAIIRFIESQHILSISMLIMPVGIIVQIMPVAVISQIIFGIIAMPQQPASWVERLRPRPHAQNCPFFIPLFPRSLSPCFVEPDSGTQIADALQGTVKWCNALHVELQALDVAIEVHPQRVHHGRR